MSNFAAEQHAEQHEDQEDLKRKEREDVFALLRECGVEDINDDVDPAVEHVVENTQEEEYVANDVEEEDFIVDSQLNQNQSDTTQPALVIPPRATSTHSHLLCQSSSAQRKLPPPNSLAIWALKEQDYLSIQLYLRELSLEIQAMVTKMDFIHACPFEGAFDGARYILSSIYPDHFTYGTKGIFSFHLPFNVSQLCNLPRYIYPNPTSIPCIAHPDFIEKVAHCIQPLITGLNYKYRLEKTCSHFDASAAAKLVLGRCSFTGQQSPHLNLYNSHSSSSLLLHPYVQPSPCLNPSNSQGHISFPFHPFRPSSSRHSQYSLYPPNPPQPQPQPHPPQRQPHPPSDVSLSHNPSSARHYQPSFHHERFQPSQFVTPALNPFRPSSSHHAQFFNPPPTPSHSQPQPPSDGSLSHNFHFQPPPFNPAYNLPSTRHHQPSFHRHHYHPYRLDPPHPSHSQPQLPFNPSSARHDQFPPTSQHPP